MKFVIGDRVIHTYNPEWKGTVYDIGKYLWIKFDDEDEYMEFQLDGSSMYDPSYGVRPLNKLEKALK